MNINQTLQGIINMANAGRNPQQIMQVLIQKNPQINQALTKLKNMAGNKSMPEFIEQYAKQNGVDQNMISQLTQIMSRK